MDNPQRFVGQPTARQRRRQQIRTSCQILAVLSAAQSFQGIRRRQKVSLAIALAAKVVFSVLEEGPAPLAVTLQESDLPAK
jgi:hypothetical protein